MTIEPGKMGLYPSCRPPLTAGQYSLELEHTLHKDGDGTDGSGLNQNIAPITQGVKVEGPRFILAPGEVHSMFPPPYDRGNFCNRLPQIVLRRRTLPWERTLDGSDAGAPWMALLLVNENENVPAPRQMTVDDMIAESSMGGLPQLPSNTPKLYAPALADLTSSERTQSCLAVDMDGRMFKAICPTPEEVELLAHVRVVSTEDKELLGQDEDGWFSVVTGHRFPDKDLNKKDGLVHRALLVSLEGQQANMTRNYSSSDRVRLVVLATWEFTSKNNGDFQTTLTNIGKNGGVGLLGDVRHNCVLQGETEEDRNSLVIETSHVPVNQSYRTGEQGVGLYRGPLTPSPIAYEPIVCHHADEALMIDPVTGLEHIGYGAAFELGRLLGASDESLAVGLMKWRRGDYEDGQGQANVADLLVDFEIPELYNEDLFKPDILGGFMDPLAPLINPGPDFVENSGNFMDLCGMSPNFVNQRFDTMVSGIAELEHVGLDTVEQELGQEGMFDQVSLESQLEFQDVGFAEHLGADMRVEIAHRNRENTKAVEVVIRKEGIVK
ncbi:MAG: hypothetical protein GY799_10870 [Desulfobulbaceae bacterium]|nr:hypothetical protein [Desulfobulbaceae bacterium]